MATTIDLKADTYTIIGKFGCGFTEVCYSIIAECERRTGQQLKKKFLMYFEDAYEHQIELLKKKLPKGVLSHYETSTSPCIFLGQKLIGDYQSLQTHLSNKYDVELNENAADAVDAAEKRRFDHMNTSPNTFVKVAILDTEHEDYGPHFINIEVFSQDLPQSSKRFLNLSQGKVNDHENPGYIDTVCGRIQKGDFLQFGKIPSLSQDYPKLEDEHFIYTHDEPGMVGFVGGKTSHTNKTEFYITLAPMKSFDKNFVVFGRVIEGLRYLNKVSDKQNSHSLIPSTKLKIQDMKNFSRKPTAEILRRQKEEKELKPHMQSYVCFNNHQEIVDFIEKYKQETIQKNYVKGPETVSIKNLKNNDDLYLLSELPLSHVHTISFKDCSFDKPSQNKLFKRHGFFMNVRHWEFLSCEITKEILKTFFINKATKSVESIVVEPRGDGVEMFKTLTKWKKLQNVTRFAFIGSRIGKEELDGFSQAPIFQRLEHLDLSHTKFYDDGLTDFITKFNNKNIRGIYLQSTGISDATAKIILTNKSFSNLEVLDLSNNFSMDCVVTGLSESKRMNHIQELYLRNTQLSMGPLDELFSSHNFSSFKRLDVSNNYNLRDDLSLSLLAKPFIRKLEHLNLENTGLTNLSLFALILNSESGHLKNLKSLDISNNPEVHVAEAFNTITSNTHLICDEVFKAKSLSEDLKYKAESEFKIRESPFIRSLHTLHMANLSLSPDLKANLEKRYQVSVELEPVVFKDYSDYMEHINVTLYDLQDQETASPKA